MSNISECGLQAIIERCSQDAGLKQQLMSNPRETLEAQGFSVSPHTELKVFEDTPEVMHLVLPVDPHAVAEDVLDQVAGGTMTEAVCPVCRKVH
jgi:hypothetical protein